MNNEQKLRELLHAALPDAPVPRRFAAEVWQRIQARNEALAHSGWRKFFEPLSALLARPAFAAAALLLSVGVAAGVASLRAADANEHARTLLANQHVATIDPYARLAVMR